MPNRPTADTFGSAPRGHRLPDQTRVGRVRLDVSDLARSVAFYRGVLGLEVVAHDAGAARLAPAGSEEPLVELRHETGTRPQPRGARLGLFHFALLLPSRQRLGQFIRHLAGRQVQFGAADHHVSEAVYLWDPDGLGIEVYADRPRSAWMVDGRELKMTTDRLDVHGLAAAAADLPDWAAMPAGTTMGHMHLSVGDLEEASRFFHEALGLVTTVWSYPGALFLAAGQYHHHLGANTWAPGATPPRPGEARLREWDLVLPTAADVHAAEDSLRGAGYAAEQGVVIDPWGTALRLTAAS